MTTLIFIHGIAVEKSIYDKTFIGIEKKLEKRQDIKVVECFWGELGAKLNARGASIPKSERGEKLTEKDQKISLWEKLYIDPLFELKLYAALPKPSSATKSKLVADLYSNLQGLKLKSVKSDLQDKLTEAGIEQIFDEAVEKVVYSEAYREAIENAPKLSSDYYDAIAKAIVAQAMFDCPKKYKYVEMLNNSVLRDKIVKLLTPYLGSPELGTVKLLLAPLKLLAEHGGTFEGRRKRRELTEEYLTFLGDILLYQTRGEEIRKLILDTIEKAEPPVVLLTHSLGGIVSIDLLVEKHLEKVELLITVGSQAPFLYEINSLHSLKYGDPLPKHFPKWLNIYDLRDFLSYVGADIFPGQVEDVKVDNNQPFMRSHDAYWENQETWNAIMKCLP